MILLQTWSGSYIELTWRVVPRWALGWIRSLVTPGDRALRRELRTPPAYSAVDRDLTRLVEIV